MKQLSDIFEQHKDKKFLFVKPGGNFGDYLIYFGAETLAKRFGVSFESISTEEFIKTPSKDVIVYIHGGGGFNEWCSGRSFDCLAYALQNYTSDVIYGPCTTSQNLDFLTERFNDCFQNVITSNVTIFARENITFELLKKIPALMDNAEIYIDHDTAFHLSKQDLIEKAGEAKTNYSLYGYRIDNESSGVDHDVNCLRVVCDPPKFTDSFEHWLRLHLHAKKIVTNRTHSSIAGAILGKETILFASKYHKNESIWHYSLKQMGVIWADNSRAKELTKKDFWARVLPMKVHKSYKVNKLMLRLLGVPRN